MKQKIISVLVMIILVITTFLFLIYSNVVMDSVTFSISVWKDNLLPSLFPFFIISELLINYGFIDLISEILKKVMNKYFHLPGDAGFVIIGSMISGFPSSAKYIKELLDKDKISIEEANYLLTFNHFSNPLFVIGTIGLLLLNNKNIGILILIVHMLSNFIIAIIFRPKIKLYSYESISIATGIKKMHKKRIENNSNFVQILTNSIYKTFKTLVLLLGIITFFTIISNLLKEILPIKEECFAIISGIFEMTAGIKNISLLNIPLIIKASLITFLISFGGLSIHMQVASILSDYNIKYRTYLIARILHGIISSGIIYIIMNFFYFL